MHPGCPSLEIQPPQGDSYTVKIEKARITVGRDPQNDIVLSNPKRTISRQHCFLEFDDNYWWVVDESPSANGTFIKRGEGEKIDVRKDGRFRLKHNDVIEILDKFLEPDNPVFWKLTFINIETFITDAVEQFKHVYLAYSLSQQKLWRVNSSKEAINLRPQAKKLIDYMAKKNQMNNNQVALCSSEELIKAIYDDGFERSNNDLTHLVWEIRKKLESGCGEAEFLKTEGRQGYTLKVKLLD
jgi:DNA-binding winged helix-turn-helix (wHTH) protein